MNDENDKIKNYSISTDLIHLTLLIFVGFLVGYLFNQLIYGLLISQSVFILYLLCTNFIFEKWLYNFKENKSNFYFKKHQNIISSINDDQPIHKLEKIQIVEQKFENLVSQFDSLVVVNKNFFTEWFNVKAEKTLYLKDVDIGKPLFHMIRNLSFIDFLKNHNNKGSVNFISPFMYNVT